MAELQQKRTGATRFDTLHEALADVAERRRKDPNWSPGADPTYSGPASLERMTEADYAAFLRQWRRDERPAKPQAEPEPAPQPIIRACMPFGQRVRDLRRALGWTQREIAWQLGISMRTVIRYEQGSTHHPKSWTLLTLQDMESDYAQKLDACNASDQRARA